MYQFGEFVQGCDGARPVCLGVGWSTADAITTQAPGGPDASVQG